MSLMTTGTTVGIFSSKMSSNILEKVSCHFQLVLQVLVVFEKEMIKHSLFDDTIPDILNNMKYYL